MYIAVKNSGEKNSSKHDIQNKVYGSTKKLKQENQKTLKRAY